MGPTLELWLSDYVLGISIRGNGEQQRKTHLQCGNLYFYDGYAHIFDIAMSDSVLNIWLTYGMAEILYVSNKRLYFSPDLMFYALQIRSWSFFK